MRQLCLKHRAQPFGGFMGKFRTFLRRFILPPLLQLAYGKNFAQLKTALAEDHLNFEQSFKAIRRLNIEVQTIIDVGASNGCWSKRAICFFPNAIALLVEANPVHKPALLHLAQNSKFRIEHAAAGERVGEIFFDISSPFGGLAKLESTGTSDARVPCITLDHAAEKHLLNGPYLIKLDTHGHELQILHGAEHVLQNATVVIIESYVFKIAPNSIKFFELCAYMEKIGFSVYDLCAPMWRRKDNSLWQMDLIFLRSSDPLFLDNNYE